MSKYLPISCVLLVVAVAQSSGSAASDASLPRYNLKVGQELSYTAQSEFNYGTGSSTASIVSREEYRAAVVRQNSDGGWHIILRTGQGLAQSIKGGKKSEEPMSYTICHFDLSPDGRIATNESLPYFSGPQAIFPRLPADPKSAADSWEGTHERAGTHSR